MKYQRYPMVMHHPAHQPAKMTRVNNPTPGMSGQAWGGDVHGTAERFPAVTVHDEDQEAYHASIGYVGSGDPLAFESAVSNPLPSGYEFQEYPKYVGEVLVNSKAEEDALGGTPAAQAASTATAAPLKKTRAPRAPKTAAVKQSYRERTGAAAPASTADVGEHA